MDVIVATHVPIAHQLASAGVLLGAPMILRTGLRETLGLYADLRRRVERSVNRDYVDCDGIPLPPYYMRVGGPAYQSDSFFLSYADSDVERLVGWFGLSERSRVLDVGCGQCRLAIGIIRRCPSIRRYVGVDLDPASLDWGRRHISARHAGFEFVRLDAQNERYNPTGKPMDETFVLPFDDASFDLVYMAGVVPHLLPDEIRAYLKEFVRVTEPGAGLYVTAFVEPGVPDVSVNPAEYLGRTWEGPRNCVRYEKDFLLSLLGSSGFEIVRFEQSAGQFGQSLIAASVRG